jgi:hypothetical protein
MHTIYASKHIRKSPLLVDGQALLSVDSACRHPVGNPKRRYDEHNSKSSLSMKPGFIEPVGERTNF